MKSNKKGVLKMERKKPAKKVAPEAEKFVLYLREQKSRKVIHKFYFDEIGNGKFSNEDNANKFQRALYRCLKWKFKMKDFALNVYEATQDGEKEVTSSEAAEAPATTQEKEAAVGFVDFKSAIEKLDKQTQELAKERERILELARNQLEALGLLEHKKAK